VKQNLRPLKEAYRIDSKLGAGTFGTVYSVEHIISGQKRVCKSISKDKSSMTSDQILKEIGSMALLDHPNVIKVYEYFDDGKYIHQIMEPCNGGELQEKIEKFQQEGKAPYDEIFMSDVVKQTLRALAFMHSIRIAHKDLKPQNIMMVERDSASLKVIDFGLAEMFDPQQKFAGQIGGTLLYMAPEVFRQQMTLKVDIWAVGVILYNLVTGGFPFIGQWPPPPGRDNAWWQEQTIGKITSEPPAGHIALRSVSPACLDLMHCMLQKDANSRPDAVQCLAHPWFHSRDHIPPTLGVGVVQCVEAFAKASELKQAIFVLIAYQCNVQALPELRALFTHFDSANQGTLSSGALRQVLSAANMEPLLAEQVVHALDRDGKTRIGWTEFTAAAMCISVCRNDRIMKSVFAALDSDGDGLIDADDFENMFAGSDIERDKWHSGLPVLFPEMFRNEPDEQATGFIQDKVLKVQRIFKGKTSKTQITKKQFLSYMGQPLQCRAGDVLNAVT